MISLLVERFVSITDERMSVVDGKAAAARVLPTSGDLTQLCPTPGR
jgi:hypothetical protein